MLNALPLSAQSGWHPWVVLSHLLTQSAKTTFLLANGKFQFFVEATDTIQLPGTKQFKQQRAYLREIT